MSEKTNTFSKGTQSASPQERPTRKRRKAAVLKGNDAHTDSHVHGNGNGTGNGDNVDHVHVHDHDHDHDTLVRSVDPLHPANHICELCRNFYTHGWVTGTGGGVSIKKGDHVYIAPSGQQKELMRPEDMFVMDYSTRSYLRRPPGFKPSACTPLFLAAFTLRGAGCCIHTHSQWAVLVTLLCESRGSADVFEIREIEQIKGISRGGSGSAEIMEGGRKAGNLGYHDTLRIPVIANTAHEEDLRDGLERALDDWPETCAVLVRRHGVYVWGRDVAQAKTQCESLDYLFRLAVEMHKLGLSWAG